jgi:hypothetical protein
MRSKVETGRIQEIEEARFVEKQSEGAKPEIKPERSSISHLQGDRKSLPLGRMRQKTQPMRT